ncbi:MAG: epoxyqueuosine reductase QueH [Oscillospiraceae bacterium]|nr:epoxyqueuosine reductase QueH [Oscillospiraceae bacterium]MDY3065030.1 epoxyqueuosine reductase QueH [Oscillospiraceae bacterium]
MNKRNVQKELDALLEKLPKDKPPRLLLHACCAPCSSYVLEYLSQYFFITLLFYNPNISPQTEYEKRYAELLRLVKEQPHRFPVSVVPCGYDPESFFSAVHGLESLPEGGARCAVCYRMRLEAAARAAKDGGFDYFTTTLSISPLKDAEKLNAIGAELSGEYGVPYLYSDFKKKEGYKRSVALSREYGLYRQNYCGCIFSKQEAERREEQKRYESNSKSL